MGALISGLLLIMAATMLSSRPLGHTDLWGHLAYGRLYDQERAFPPTEPFLPLSSDQDLVSTSWLSQWVGYRVHQSGGTVALQLLYAILVCGTVGCFLWVTHLKTRSWSLAILGGLCFVYLEYQQLRVIRPQLAGLFCFVWFLSFLQAHHRSTARQLSDLFALMVAWTNLHGSFAIAPAVLMIVGMGRIIDLLRIRHQRGATPASALRFMIHDRRLQSLSLMLLVAAFATLINPYGWRLWPEVVTFSHSTNLYDLIEWKPLWKTPKQGTVILIFSLLTVISLFVSRVRLRMEQWLPVLIIGVLMLRTSRYVVWWSPLLLLALIPHWKLIGDCRMNDM